MADTTKKVLVGMSGGVDSSVSAALLLEQGYEVIGAFMKNWSNCEWRADQRDATRVAAQLGIPFVTLDFEAQYRQDVVEYLFREFEIGRTPNPDVMCNKFIKFDRFIRAADEMGCEFIATGHYACISCHPERAKRAEGSRVQLLRAADYNKDQTYFLWAINPAVLKRVLFPIGHMTKPEVRAKARELGLAVADKKDSTGICFIGEVNLPEFLRTRIKEEPGHVVTMDGTRVGKHIGVNFYTIGQRHGLGIGGGTPYYVVEKRPEVNELVVASNYHPRLYASSLRASMLNVFCDRALLSTPLACQARIRHRQPLQNCTAVVQGDQLRVEFDKPQRAVTPGQSVVLYKDDIVLAGGIIDSTGS